MVDENIRTFKDGNRWWAQYVSGKETTVYGCGVTPETAIEDLKKTVLIRQCINHLREEYRTIWEIVQKPCQLSRLGMCERGCPFSEYGYENCPVNLIHDILYKYSHFLEQEKEQK